MEIRARRKLVVKTETDHFVNKVNKRCSFFSSHFTLLSYETEFDLVQNYK